MQEAMKFVDTDVWIHGQRVSSMRFADDIDLAVRISRSTSGTHRVNVSSKRFKRRQ